MNDIELLTLLDQDPNQGMEELLKQYHSLLWYICSQKLQNEEDIKEVLNDVFASFYMHRDEFDIKKGSLKNYLCLVANRRAIEKYRSLSSRKEEELVIDIAQEESDPVWKITLEEAMDKLSHEDAQIIRMKYYEGMSYQEIADALHISYESAKKRGQRNVSKLRKWIIVIIILAVLVGCAIAIHYFQFSKKSGLNFDLENPMYEMEQNEKNSAKLDETNVEIQQLIYYGDSLNILLGFEPLGVGEQARDELQKIKETVVMYINDQEVRLDKIETVNYAGSYLLDETIDFPKEQLQNPITISFREIDNGKEIQSLSFSMMKMNEQEMDINNIGTLITYPEGSVLVQSTRTEKGIFVDLFPALDSQYKISQNLLMKLKMNPQSEFIYLLDSQGNKIYSQYSYSTNYRLGNSFKFFFETEDKNCQLILDELLLISSEMGEIEEKNPYTCELGPKLEIQAIDFYEQELKEEDLPYLEDIGISFDEIIKTYHQLEINYNLEQTDIYSVDSVQLQLSLYLDDGTILPDIIAELDGNQNRVRIDMNRDLNFDQNGKYSPHKWINQKVEKVDFHVRKLEYWYKKKYKINV